MGSALCIVWPLPVLAYVAQGLIDRVLIACTATDAHNATQRVPCGISNEWSTSLLAVIAGEET